MSTNIFVDSREKQNFQDILSREGVHHTVKFLKYGDIQFEINGSPVLIIERKTYDDLNGSITDGRSHKQAYSLKEIDKNSKVMVAYLIEKKISPSLIHFEQRMLQAMINKQVRDGFHVFHTQGPEDTALHLMKIKKCIDKHGTFKALHKEEETFTSTIKLPKCSKKNDPLCIYICMLRTVPLVSDKVARAIVTVHPSMAHIILYMSEHGPLSLKDIPIGKTRKVGQALSKKIYSILFCTVKPK